MKPDTRGCHMNDIRIVLADDHKLFRDGMKKLLDQEPDISIVGEASDGEEAVRVVQEKKPDVLLFDINMPRMDGIQLVRELNNLVKNLRYVAVSAYDDE